jgi:hypothetical protein
MKRAREPIPYHYNPPPMFGLRDAEEEAWHRFYRSPEFAAMIREAMADMEAGRVYPMPTTDTEWEEFRSRASRSPDQEASK